MFRYVWFAIPCAVLLAPLHSSAQSRAPISLKDPRFNASGRGDVTTPGSIAQGSTTLEIARAETWRKGYGIRIQRAGDDSPLHHADSGWSLPPAAPAGANVAHDAEDKVEGTASVRCALTGGAASPVVDLCEVNLGARAHLAFDEVRLWIKASVATRAGDLRIRTMKADRVPTFDLDLPALAAGQWTEVFVELKRKRRIGLDMLTTAADIVGLQCAGRCEGIVVHVDDLVGVRDLIAGVTGTERVPGGPVRLELDRPAGRTVMKETVYHDDTRAAVAWLQAAQAAGATLYAPEGVYYVNSIQMPIVGGLEASYSLPLHDGTTLRCAHPKRTIFKNTGRSWNGPKVMFRAAAAAPTNITIAGCGFDTNGWNLQDFLGVLTIKPQNPPPEAKMGVVRDIKIRGNNFFDGALPGLEGCDADRLCVTRQRQYILVQRVDGLWVEKNRLSGGGRIKTGGAGLGRRMYIRGNVLDFVNDNGITILDSVPGVTEQVEISDNTIRNPVLNGICFGADGEPAALVPGMVVRDVTIARNRITGFFGGAGILGQLPRTAGDIEIVDNIIKNHRDTALPAGYYASGIFVGQEVGDADPMVGLRVERNDVAASGPYSMLNVGGIVLRTRSAMKDVTIAKNSVRCDGCPIERNSDALAVGIRLWYGTYDAVKVHGNRANRANLALQLGAQVGCATRITNASILGNIFRGSASPLGGQITFSTLPGDRIEARVIGNRLEDGRGHGIWCDGTLVELGELTSNRFAGNAGSPVYGCP